MALNNFILFFAGKTCFFVYNQEKIESMPSDKLVELKKDLASLEDKNKLLANEVKTYTIGILRRKSFVLWYWRAYICHIELSKLKATPTDEDIDGQIAGIEELVGLLFLQYIL